MNLAVEGMSEAEAGELGKQVAERVAAGLPVGYDRLLPVSDLNLRFRPESGMSPDELADQIAAKLLQQLNML